MATSFETSTTATPKKQKIRGVVRNASEREWLNVNPVPDKGELVYTTDTNTLKIGDGLTHYDDLPTISGGGSGTTDYTQLSNKPSINSVTLLGNKTAADLGFATVATTGDYDDLTDKPVLGTAAAADTSDFATAAQGEKADTAVQPESLATVATTGSYTDLSNKPTIPTVNNPTITITQGGVTKGSFTLNQASSDTIALDAGSGSQVQSDWDQTDITAVDYIKNKPTALSDFTNDEGFISGITSSDVTTALGYTPYNSTNPNGYTSNVGTVTSVNNTNPDANGNVSLSIPTVNDATITITQGGVTKGTFTLNQSSSDTIALDDLTGATITLRDWSI